MAHFTVTAFAIGVTVGVYALDDAGTLDLLQTVDGLPLTKPSGLVVR